MLTPAIGKPIFPCIEGESAIESAGFGFMNADPDAACCDGIGAVKRDVVGQPVSRKGQGYRNKK